MITRGGRLVAAFVAVILVFFTWAFPVLWTALTSFKLAKDIFAYPPKLTFEPTELNYQDVLGGDQSLVADLVTSTVISLGATVLSVAAAIPMAYVFARCHLRFKNALALYTLFTYMIPRIGLVIPFFVAFRAFGLTGTYVGLIAVYLSFSLPFAVWLMVPYFEDLPREMEEASLLDRAGRWRTLWYVILPQVRGGIAITAIFVFITAWNEFLFGVVLSGSEIRPVTVAMYNFIGVEQTLWGPLTAGAIVAMIPVIVLGLGGQRGIVRGLTAGSIKGGSRG
ncbi:MAG: carbohydrate ABC transporter permease [Micromonosporaceae bacterium]